MEILLEKVNALREKYGYPAFTLGKNEIGEPYLIGARHIFLFDIEGVHDIFIFLRGQYELFSRLGGID